MAKAHAKVPGLRLRLYVAGHAPNSVRAVANVRAICDEHFASGHELEIVDLLDHPKRALADGIIVTPTLLKLLPLPAHEPRVELNEWFAPNWCPISCET